MTYQSREILKVGDEKLYIMDGRYPLEHYFSDGRSVAEHWNLTSLSTAENRGYDATWAVRDGALYLVDIFTYRIVVKGFWFWRKTSYPELVVADLFPDAINGEVKASWFNGSFSAFTKSARNPIDDRLFVKFEKGELVTHQWFHLEENNRLNGTPYDKPLP